jgi:hypothetical protein
MTPAAGMHAAPGVDDEGQHRFASGQLKPPGSIFATDLGRSS